MKRFITVATAWILSPLWLFGFVVGYLIQPMVRGFVQGVNLLVSWEQQRAEGILQNHFNKRAKEAQTKYEKHMQQQQEGK